MLALTVRATSVAEQTIRTGVVKVFVEGMICSCGARSLLKAFKSKNGVVQVNVSCEEGAMEFGVCGNEGEGSHEILGDSVWCREPPRDRVWGTPLLLQTQIKTINQDRRSVLKRRYPDL